MNIDLTPHNIVLDLETLATAHNAVILSIGAVAVDFETPKILSTFHASLDHREGLRKGLVKDERIVTWWKKQHARAVHEAFEGEFEYKRGLERFREWCKEVKGRDGAISMWGNGSDFDNVILKSSFDAFKVPIPWHYQYNRCFRTLKSLFPAVKSSHSQPKHLKHIAHEDALYEAYHLINIIRHIQNA